MPSTVARHLTAHGHVQGVFFRAGTQERAAEHGVRGWVANRPDGGVEAWLEGAPEAVAAVESWIRSGGPPDASVSGVEAADVTPTGHAGFTVRG